MNDEDLHIVEEHFICPCSQKDPYESMQLPSMMCRQVPDLESRLQRTEKRLDILENSMKRKEASEVKQKP